MKPNLPPIILASVSPRREELLRHLGLDFAVVASDATEAHHEQLTAREISQLNAYRKARAVAKRSPEALVIGADTLVFRGTTLRETGGPRGCTADVARVAGAHARGGDGRLPHAPGGASLPHFSETSSVTFHPLTDAMIDDYLGRVHTLDKAGAYAVQEHGHRIIEEISGSFSNVVGLPVGRVRQLLEAW